MPEVWLEVEGVTERNGRQSVWEGLSPFPHPSITPLTLKPDSFVVIPFVLCIGFLLTFHWRSLVVGVAQPLYLGVLGVRWFKYWGQEDQSSAQSGGEKWMAAENLRGTLREGSCNTVEIVSSAPPLAAWEMRVCLCISCFKTRSPS